MKLYTQHNQLITLTSEVGKGGEATIYDVAEHPDMVAKIYHQPTPAHEAKLRAMIANPPKQPPTHIAIAWPTELLYQMGEFVGFLMPKITNCEPLFKAYNPVLRGQTFPDFTWRALHRIASNLAVAVGTVHAKGYVIGDLNESNILVNERGLVAIVDSDSFQVVDEAGMVHRCGVGKAEYTPPELQGVNFREVDQTIEHDLFALGVLIFQLLMEGYHPFAGVLKSNLSVERVDLYAIRQGLFPYVSDNKNMMTPPPLSPELAWLDQNLQMAFHRCFIKGHRHPIMRPMATEWQPLLQQAMESLTPCRVKRHVYAQQLDHCPWCELEQRRQEKLTPAPSVELEQRPYKKIIPAATAVTTSPPLPQAPFSRVVKPKYSSWAKEWPYVLITGGMIMAFFMLCNLMRLPNGSGTSNSLVKVPLGCIPQCQSSDLQRKDLARLHLKGVNFSLSNLSQANLSYVNLSQANLQSANLQGANLMGADLGGANLSQANLQSANLQGANLIGANLEGVNLNDVLWLGVRLDDTTRLDEKWRIVWNIVNIPEFRRNITYADLSHVNFNAIPLSFSEMNLKGFDFMAANLSQAKFTNVKVIEVNFVDARLDNADFTQAEIRRTNFKQAYLRSAHFVQASMDEVNLEGANLEQTDFRQAQLRDSNLMTTNLKGANFEGANLLNVNLQGANLQGVNLTQAKLSGVDLRGCNLIGLDLSQALIQDNTLLEDKWRLALRIQRGEVANFEFGAVDLSQTFLAKMNLAGANLKGANLVMTNLAGANLSLANLSGANLTGADLSGTQLEGTTINLAGANLKGANLSSANLSGANLRGADLSETNLEGAILTGATMPDGTIHK